MNRTAMLFPSVLALLTLAGCAGTDVPPQTAEPDVVGPEVEAAPTGCTVDFTSQTVDGSTLWTDIPDATDPKNCNFHRLALNNFLYYAGGDTPRFLSELVSTATLNQNGAWPTGDAAAGAAAAVPLRKVTKVALDDDAEMTPAQAGDAFELVDVNDQTVLYDIRINETLWDSAKPYNTSAALCEQKYAYDQNPSTGGIWVAPTKDTDTTTSVEIKTSWRNFSAAGLTCPSDIMFCTEIDGATWGLLGMHYVQKTPTRGEWIWGSFEHVGNSPDCASGNSNPIQQFPRDPTNPSATINVNGDGATSGWSLFDYTAYTAGGGDGSTCTYPQGTLNQDTQKCENATHQDDAQCNGDPIDGEGWKHVDICRADPVPDHTSTDTVCADTSDNGNNVACLSQSILDNWPSDLDPRWKYYMPIGTEWLNATKVPVVGCFDMVNTENSQLNFSCKQPADGTAATYESFPTTGTTALANTTMETWMQDQMCAEYSDDSVWGEQDCFSCHSPKATKPTTTGSETTADADLSHMFGKLVNPSDTCECNKSTGECD